MLRHHNKSKTCRKEVLCPPGAYVAGSWSRKSQGGLDGKGGCQPSRATQWKRPQSTLKKMRPLLTIAFETVLLVLVPSPSWPPSPAQRWSRHHGPNQQQPDRLLPARLITLCLKYTAVQAYCRQHANGSLPCNLGTSAHQQSRE